MHADVAELADASDLGSDAARRGGSSPFIRTKSFKLQVSSVKLIPLSLKSKTCSLQLAAQS